MKTLGKSSLDWSLKHLKYESDTDLLPHPFEIKIIEESWTTLSAILQKTDITSYVWQGVRNMLVPKDELAFRSVCQLDPIDSLLFSSIIKEIGRAIEKKRVQLSEEKVFSYRFNPTSRGHFYGGVNLWESFWQKSIRNADKLNFVAVTDITDFYNQIYHHTIENQLDICNIEKSYKTAILNLLKKATQSISRGVPIGPHASHILAELSLMPVDEFLSLKGYQFCRYVDDIHIFCETREEGRNAIYDLANILDKTQKLSLNRSKTDVLTKEKFLIKAHSMIVDAPINEEEKLIVNTIRCRSKTLYMKINLSKLTDEEMKELSQENIETVLESYIDFENPNYVRLRWFLRRLSQAGVPGGVEFIVRNIEAFMPAIGDAADYIKSAKSNYDGDWKKLGEQLLDILNSPVIVKNEYLQAVILDIFSKVKDLNNIERLIQNYEKYNSTSKRGIVLAATEANATGWLRMLKNSYADSEPWLRRAIIYSAKTLPKDERTFWLKSVKLSANELEKAIIETVK